MNIIYAIPIVIYFILPLIGLFFYFKLCAKMKNEMDNAPVVRYFFLFVIYGGFFQVLLTSVIWKWSGLASLGAFFLILAAPVICIIIATMTFKERKLSVYHKWEFILSLFYVIMTAVILTFMLIFFNK